MSPARAQSPAPRRPSLAGTVRLRTRSGRTAVLTFWESSIRPAGTVRVLPGVAVLARWEDARPPDFDSP